MGAGGIRSSQPMIVTPKATQKPKRDLPNRCMLIELVVRCFFGDDDVVHVAFLEPGRRVRLNFHDYSRPGDTLGIELDISSDRLLGLTVHTWMDSPDDKVNMTAAFALLKDGATYADQVRLEMPAKKLTVAVDNSGYRKLGN